MRKVFLGEQPTAGRRPRRTQGGDVVTPLVAETRHPEG